MPRKQRLETANEDTGSSLLDDFDYHVECDDFLLYELGRIVEDDRASFEDEEFRRIIHEGIHQHVEIQLTIRSELAREIRARGPGRRLLRAVEDIEYPLQDVELIVRTYTTYMFRRLEECASGNTAQEDEARSWIERWQRGEVLREQVKPR